MSFGNALIEIERIKELSLISGLASHHRRNPLANRRNGITPLRLRQRVFQQHRSRAPVHFAIGTSAVHIKAARGTSISWDFIRSTAESPKREDELPHMADSVEKLSGAATSLRFGDVFKIGGLTPCRMAAATSPR